MLLRLQQILSSASDPSEFSVSEDGSAPSQDYDFGRLQTMTPEKQSRQYQDESSESAYDQVSSSALSLPDSILEASVFSTPESGKLVRRLGLESC